MDKDHISRDAALAELQRVYDLLSGYHPSFYAGFQFAVKTLESIQAADVVLCKDCAYCYREGSGTMTMYTCAFPRGGLRKLLDPEKDFCSCGTWRTNNGKA